MSTSQTLGSLMVLCCLIAEGRGLGQGVTLPPISATEVAAPPPPRTLPQPTPTDGKPLGPPPQLGGPLKPGLPIGVLSDRPLPLHLVLASVDRHYPLVQAAEQERLITAGRLTSAQGAFDLNLRSQEFFTDGTYDNQRYSLFVEQLSPFQGLSYFAGYRLGAGNYPVYYGDRKTAEGGEFRAGVVLPILRNREIDRARANQARAAIDRQAAEPTIQLQRLDIARAATRAYWTWAAAGQRLLIAEQILRIAQQRDPLLGQRVKIGTLPRIEQEDNRRAIVEREARVVVARRLYEQASITLSLYLRNEAGQPVIPCRDEVPPFADPAPPPDKERRQADLAEALRRRPELARLELQRQKILVDLQLAENQMLPGLNVGLTGAHDVGFGKRSPQSTSPLGRETYELALLFDVPLQRRDARGRILTARAELARIASQEQFQRDRVQADIQDAANALDRAYDLLRRGRDNRLQTTYLEEAERRQFDIGKSDLFRVNLRELMTAEARFLEIDAAAEFYRALADYAAALGIDTSRPGDESGRKSH